MGAGVSACQYSEETLPKVTAFAEKVTESSKTLPSKDEAKDSKFSAGDEEITVPQKYIWVQSICSPFVLYTNMNGKNLPELWDEIAGAGFTDHSAEDIQKISSQVILATLAPEIKDLIEADVEENEENQPKWDSAIATVLHRNVSTASARDEASKTPLAGTPDAALEVDAEAWAAAVYSPPVDTYPAPSTSKQTENPVAAEDEEGAQAAKKQKTEETPSSEAPVEEVAAVEATTEEVPAESAEAPAETTEDESPVTAFCKDRTSNLKHMPSKDDAKDTGFSPAPAEGEVENEPVNVPQKYIWLNSLCVNFVQFGNLAGKTLPELWDSKFDSGFTDYGAEELHAKGAELLESILHSDVRALVEKGVKESDEQEPWSVACGKAIYENCAQAKATAAAAGKEIDIQFALAGSPDEAFPVADEDQWKKSCVWFPQPMFTEGGKLNGNSNTKAQLEAILGREVADDEIETVDEEE